MKHNVVHYLAESILQPISAYSVIILGAYTTLWGMWVANPFWKVFSHAALYSEMAHIMPEWCWGAAAIICGAITMYGMIRPSFRSLSRGSHVMFFHWAAIAMLYFIGDWQNTGGITSLFLCIHSGLIYLNLRANKAILGLPKSKENDILRKRRY